MQTKALLGSALAASLLAGSASALVDTSPMVVVSNSKAVELPNESQHMPSAQVVGRLLEGSTEKCSYNAYIFVNHPNVSDKDINKRTMPFFSHAMDKAEAAFPFPSVPKGPETSIEAISTLKQMIESECGAIQVSADTKSSTPLSPVTDDKPRIVSVDFDGDVPANEADETLRKVLGHLATGDFFLFYRTTPHEKKSAETYSVVSNTGAASETGSASEGVPYESVFRNYQFFSPALFMCLMASGLLIVVFLLAFNAVDSLQISPAAFEPKRQPLKKK